jgi:Holliday junction resolvase RusA-like endonuclease
MISFTVPGVPAPQGSKTRTRWGGIREDNPATRPWREAVTWEAVAAMTSGEPDSQSRVLGVRPPLDGPLELNVTFVFPRPKSHYGTGRNAGTLKKTAPIWCATKPDVDKLVRAVADSMTGIVYRDDSQLVQVTAVKTYGQPRAIVVVTTKEDT